MFDVFRQKPGEVQEGICMDDPTLPKIDIEDIKSYGDSGYHGHNDARYNPPKWAKNQLHTLNSNSWVERGEPPLTAELKAPHDKFMDMVGSTFGHVADSHKMGAFKRYVSLVIGNNALYVRLPSERKDVPIYRFAEEDVCARTKYCNK